MSRKVVRYFAATEYEGCGHLHLTKRAARRCLPRIDGTRGKPRIYTYRYRITKVNGATS